MDGKCGSLIYYGIAVGQQIIGADDFGTLFAELFQSMTFPFHYFHLWFTKTRNSGGSYQTVLLSSLRKSTIPSVFLIENKPPSRISGYPHHSAIRKTTSSLIDLIKTRSSVVTHRRNLSNVITHLQGTPSKNRT